MNSIPDSHGIYKIINIINNKVYIGSAVNLRRRKNKHYSTLLSGKHQNIILQQAYNKYGIDNIIFKIIELVLDKGDLIEREQFYIDKFQSFKKKNGYNICAFAGSTLGIPAKNKGVPCPGYVKEKIRKANTGRKVPVEQIQKRAATIAEKGGIKYSDETKEKIRLSKIGEKNPFFGKSHTQESIRKISNAQSGSNNHFFGKTHSEEFRKKSSLIHKGKKLSIEIRAKLSAAGKGRKQSPEHIAKRIAKALITKAYNKNRVAEYRTG